MGLSLNCVELLPFTFIHRSIERYPVTLTFEIFYLGGTSTWTWRATGSDGWKSTGSASGK